LSGALDDATVMTVRFASELADEQRDYVVEPLPTRDDAAKDDETKPKWRGWSP